MRPTGLTCTIEKHFELLNILYQDCFSNVSSYPHVFHHCFTRVATTTHPIADPCLLRQRDSPKRPTRPAERTPGSALGKPPALRNCLVRILVRLGHKHGKRTTTSIISQIHALATWHNNIQKSYKNHFRTLGFTCTYRFWNGFKMNCTKRLT